MERTDNGFIKIDVKDLIDWHGGNGEGCIASDKVTKDGFKVGYMYREDPSETMPDSGWRFLAGDESDEYMDNDENAHVFSINTICNYDPDIIPHLNAPYGSAFIRIDSHTLELDDRTKPIFLEKQDIAKND